MGALQTSRVALLLEENSNSDVYKALERVISAFAEYVEGLRQDIQHPENYSAVKRGEQERQINDDVKKFSALLYTRLAK